MKKLQHIPMNGESKKHKTKPKIAAIVFSTFPRDPRPRREAEALLEAGMKVDLFCIQRDEQPAKEKLGDLTVYRTNIQKRRTSKSRYLWQYGYFFFVIFFKLSFYQLTKKYSLIHIHNMPDILVFTALIPKLTGAKILLDLHDPMPEMFITKYSMSGDSKLIRLLRFFERKSINFADEVITPNKSFVNLFMSRGTPKSKINIIMNSPQESVFKPIITPQRPPFNKDQFVLMYHGVIVKRYGLDTALYSMLKIQEKIPNLKFKVWGSGDFEREFKKLNAELKLEKIVKYYGSVPLEEIADQIRHVDLGIIPNKSTTFTHVNFPTRIFEYLCLGKPVIVPRTQGILDYFNEDEIYYFNPGDEEDLAKVILQVYNNPDECYEKIKRGFEVYKKFTWLNQKEKLINIVNQMSGFANQGPGKPEHEINKPQNKN